MDRMRIAVSQISPPWVYNNRDDGRMKLGSETDAGRECRVTVVRDVEAS
jgi:hypothetical protein